MWWILCHQKRGNSFFYLEPFYLHPFLFSSCLGKTSARCTFSLSILGLPFPLCCHWGAQILFFQTVCADLLGKTYDCCCWVTSLVSDSVWPHRRQPTRLPCPWDSPGKNTGVGFHFLFQCMKVISEREVAQSCQTLRDPMDCSLPGSYVHGIFQARVLEWVAIAFSIT